MEAEERGPAEPYDVVVNNVRPGTPAAQAGLQTGDLILSVDGRRVGTIADISEVLQSKRVGDRLQISVRRGDSQMDLQVSFAAAANRPPLGPAPPLAQPR